MEQRLSLVTLGVADYARSKAFYESLGWTTAMDVEDSAFFQANSTILVLWSRAKLADDMGISGAGATPASSATSTATRGRSRTIRASSWMSAAT